jgi:hypothetical protein
MIDQDLVLQELEFLDQLKGMHFDKLPRNMIRRIKETQVPVYLIQPGTPDEVKFNVFKRINTGGLPLSPQEIRHALNQGPAAILLERLADSQEFLRAVNWGIRDDRMTDRECVLRFFTFVLTSPEGYRSRDLDGFLHEQMQRLNKMPGENRDALAERFLRAMRAARRIFDNDAFRKRYAIGARRRPINKALFESWSVNLDRRTDADLEALYVRRSNLIQGFARLMASNREFDLAVSQGTGSAARVRLRFREIENLIDQVLSA